MLIHPRTTGMAHNFHLCHKKSPIPSTSQAEPATHINEHKSKDILKDISPALLVDEVCKS